MNDIAQDAKLLRIHPAMSDPLLYECLHELAPNMVAMQTEEGILVHVDQSAAGSEGLPLEMLEYLQVAAAQEADWILLQAPVVLPASPYHLCH